MKITVLVENFAGTRSMLAEHGLSILVSESSSSVLMDTGQGDALLPNMQALGIEPEGIDHLVLSHGHFDHTGGIQKLLLRTGNIPVWGHNEIEMRHSRLENGSGKFTGCHINRHGIDFRPIKGVVGIIPNVWALEVPMDHRDPEFMSLPPKLVVPEGEKWKPDHFPDDISLAVKGEKGLSVILGCAHAGVVNILEEVSARFGTRSFHMVLGGMHIGDQSHDFIDRITTELTTRFTVEKWRPCHCSGLKALCAFSERAEDVSWAGAGTRIEI